MDQETFKVSLVRMGLPEPILVEREAGELGEHAHPFEVNAFILDGNITLTIDGVATQYFAGDTFHLLPDVQHSESYGAQGVSYLASRKDAEK